MIKAIAIDDEPPALEVLEAFCERTNQIDLQKTFTRTGEAHEFLREQAVDLIFLDINMPAQSGIDFVREIAQLAIATGKNAKRGPAATPPERDRRATDIASTHQPERERHAMDRRPTERRPTERRPTERMVIFTTAYSEYAVESYTLNAVDYLLKPFTFERFLGAAQKAHDQFMMRQQTEASQDYLLLRVDYGLVKVYLAQILFIEGLDNYLKIHLVDQRPVVVRLTIKAMLDKLPAWNFVRVHRSYIVALSKVQSMRNKLILIEHEEIPLSSSYEAEFLAAFKG